MNQVQLLIIGGLIALFSAIITQLVNYLLSRKRDKANWQKEETHRTEDRLIREVDTRKDRLAELKSENAELKSKNVELRITSIILRNQNRDILLGFNQDEQYG